MSEQLVEIHCRKCGVLFHACNNSLADKSQLCGNCAYIRCPECRKKFMLNDLKTDNILCPYCNADCSEVFKND